MNAADVGVYVHVPFCERVCPYCDFAVVAARELSSADETRYVDALLAEFDQRAGVFSGRQLASVYLGGGTPSLLRPGSLGRILQAILGRFPGDVEITLEVNPSTLERERLCDFKRSGVNRVSIGVQSFDDETLRRLGRAHRAGMAHDTLDAARSAGFASIALDLIVAAPHQEISGVNRDLDAAIAFDPDHISVYELTVEHGTPFAIADARGQLRRADEEQVVAMLEGAEGRLSEAGFERYEISNYAKPGRESVHNRRYWERRPVLALGMGAVSTDPPAPEYPFGVRRANPRQLRRYLEGVDRAAPAPAEVLTGDIARGEAVFLALRTAAGLNASRFAEEFGAPPRSFFEAPIERFRTMGLLAELPGGDLRLTARGRLLADSIAGHFV